MLGICPCPLYMAKPKVTLTYDARFDDAYILCSKLYLDNHLSLHHIFSYSMSMLSFQLLVKI